MRERPERREGSKEVRKWMNWFLHKKRRSDVMCPAKNLICRESNWSFISPKALRNDLQIHLIEESSIGNSICGNTQQTDVPKIVSLTCGLTDSRIADLPNWRGRVLCKVSPCRALVRGIARGGLCC